MPLRKLAPCPFQESMSVETFCGSENGLPSTRTMWHPVRREGFCFAIEMASSVALSFAMTVADACWFLGSRCSVSFTEVKLNFFEEGRKEIFFRKTGVHVFSAIHRTVAGDDDHGSVWALLADPMRQFDAIHPVHTEVRDQDV